jgi:hypothetical protein
MSDLFPDFRLDCGEKKQKNPAASGSSEDACFRARDLFVNLSVKKTFYFDLVVFEVFPPPDADFLDFAPEADFAAAPDFEVFDFAAEDDFASPDFADVFVVDFAEDDFAADFAEAVFDVDFAGFDFGAAVFSSPFSCLSPAISLTVSTVALSAPNAAPVAASIKISPATSFALFKMPVDVAFLELFPPLALLLLAADDFFEVDFGASGFAAALFSPVDFLLSFFVGICFSSCKLLYLEHLEFNTNLSRKDTIFFRPNINFLELFLIYMR